MESNLVWKRESEVGETFLEQSRFVSIIAE